MVLRCAVRHGVHLTVMLRRPTATVPLEPWRCGNGIASHLQHCLRLRAKRTAIQRASGVRLLRRRISWGIVTYYCGHRSSCAVV